MSPCAPPELDLEAWDETIAEIENRAPSCLALTHFGLFEDVESHLSKLRATLARWSEWVEDGMDEQLFVAAATHDVSRHDPELVNRFEHAGPYWHHFRGLERYWRKKRQTVA